MSQQHILAHSSDLGDVIASLPILRAVGGGKLIIGPPKRNQGRESLKGARFESLKPLLDCQPYVHSVEWQDNPKDFTYDLRSFRSNDQRGENLLDWQARMAAIKVTSAPWLRTYRSPVSLGRTVVARSARYHNPKFPWMQIMRERGKPIFVGLESEYHEFHRNVADADYVPTKNLLELAEVIAGADLFVGNQSCPFWVAAGLGVPLIQEVWEPGANSIVPRANARYLRGPEESKPMVPPPLHVMQPELELPVAPVFTGSLICVLAFCLDDHKAALELARHIASMGGVSRHKCLLVHPNNVDGQLMKDTLGNAFSEISEITYAPRFGRAWPDGPNQCFYEAAKAIHAMVGKEPWIFVESDCVPTRPPWLDEIAYEYFDSRKLILGVISDTIGPNGGHSGKNVEGVAVYPHDFYQRSASLRGIVEATAQYRRANSTPPAFNCYISPYTVPHCAQARTIRHYWKSHSFEESAGTVRCEFRSPYGASNIVDMSAALIHGCKDFSLLDIVQARLVGGGFRFSLLTNDA